MPVPNQFANVTTSIPLSQLDANFNTPITLGNTAIQLGNTVTTLNNMTLANVTVSSGNVTITNVSVTTANVTTANIATAQIANVTVSGTSTFAAGSNTAPSITFTGDTNTGIYSPSADTIAIGTGGTAAVTVTPSQNVGIGTSSPGYTASNRTVLQVNGSSQSLISLAYGGTNAWYAYADSSNTILLSEGARNLTIGTVGAAPQIFTTNNTERARFNASAPILCLAGGNTSATGTGIAFPATQSASSDANTLDDYEEGTWNAVLTYSTTLTNTSPSTQTTLTGRGLYTKVGNICTVSVYVDRTDIGSNFILSTISGLPFTSFTSGGTGAAVTASLYLIKAQYGATDITNPVSNCQVNPNNASFATLLANNNTGSGYLTFVIGSQALFTTTYRVA